MTMEGKRVLNLEGMTPLARLVPPPYTVFHGPIVENEEDSEESECEFTPAIMSSPVLHTIAALTRQRQEQKLGFNVPVVANMRKGNLMKEGPVTSRSSRSATNEIGNQVVEPPSVIVPGLRPPGMPSPNITHKPMSEALAAMYAARLRIPTSSLFKRQLANRKAAQQRMMNVEQPSSSSMIEEQPPPPWRRPATPCLPPPWRGDYSEMSERLATEQPLKEYALAWDMRSYTLAEFINYYGVPEAHDFWQPSLHATADARAAIRILHEVDGPAMANFWALISGWVPTAPTVEAANDLMLSAFYIPLRWRYEFLQSRGVLPEMWSSCDLSAQQDQKATWAYVKDSVATFALTPQQRALGRRNILALVINKLCKNTHLCKLLLNYGVADAQSLTTILGALAVRRARPQPHAQQQQQEHQAVTVAAQHTIDVPRAQATLRLRSRSRTRVPRYN